MKSCEYCEKRKNIFELEYLGYPFSWAWGIEEAITKDKAKMEKDIVFIDRDFLRVADPEDCSCMDHGKRIKISFCPFCGNNLKEQQ